jgi:hypothetical protein
MSSEQESRLQGILQFYKMDRRVNGGLLYSVVFKSKVIIKREGCKINLQHFFIRHKSHQELVEFVSAMHEISRCSCGVEWPFFEVFAYKPGENLIIR